MKKEAASLLRLLAVAWALSTPGVAKATEAGMLESRGGFLLAEIVLPGQADSSKQPSNTASDARVKAKAYQESGSGSGNTTILVVPEEEEGLLGPRRQPDSGASDNRSRARQYQQNKATPLVPVPLSRDAANPLPTTAERAQDNRAKARTYVSTDNTVVIQRIGSDGIPIVSCAKLVDNVAGRIGDDVQPGGVFYIIRENKPFKVRCAQ